MYSRHRGGELARRLSRLLLTAHGSSVLILPPLLFVIPQNQDRRAAARKVESDPGVRARLVFYHQDQFAQ